MRLIKGTLFFLLTFVLLFSIPLSATASNYKVPKVETERPMLILANDNGNIGRFYCIANNSFLVNPKGQLQQLYIGNGRRRRQMRCSEINKINVKYLLQLLDCGKEK